MARPSLCRADGGAGSIQLGACGLARRERHRDASAKSVGRRRMQSHRRARRSVGRVVSGNQRDRGDAVEVMSLWVAPSARGIGVGDALIDAIARWADGLGANRMVLRVVASYEPAIALDRRNGVDEGLAIEDGVGGLCELELTRRLGRESLRDLPSANRRDAAVASDAKLQHRLVDAGRLEVLTGGSVASARCPRWQSEVVRVCHEWGASPSTKRGISREASRDLEVHLLGAKRDGRDAELALSRAVGRRILV